MEFAVIFKFIASIFVSILLFVFLDRHISDAVILYYKKEHKNTEKRIDDALRLIDACQQSLFSHRDYLDDFQKRLEDRSKKIQELEDKLIEDKINNNN